MHQAGGIGKGSGFSGRFDSGPRRAGVPEAPGSRRRRSPGLRHPTRCAPRARGTLAGGTLGGAASSRDPTWSRWSADRPHQRLHRPAAWMGCGWTLAFRLRYVKLVDKALPELMPPEVMLVLPRGAVNHWRSGRCLHRSQSRRVLASGAMERPGIKVSLGVFVCPDPRPGASLAARGRTASAPAQGATRWSQEPRAGFRSAGQRGRRRGQAQPVGGRGQWIDCGRYRRNRVQSPKLVDNPASGNRCRASTVGLARRGLTRSANRPMLAWVPRLGLHSWRKGTQDREAVPSGVLLPAHRI